MAADPELLGAFERRAYQLSEAAAYERDYDARQGATREAENTKRVEGYLSGLGLGDMVPTPAEYDYAAMLSDGVVPKADPSGRVPLPPQYWKPGHLVVRGIDLATGERLYGGPSLEDMLLDGAQDDGAGLMDAELTPADLDELDLPARASLEAWMATRGMQVVAQRPTGSAVDVRGAPNKQGAADAGMALLDSLAGALRGATAQTLGLPGDIESLVRMLAGGEQVLPTTEDVAAALPPVVPDGDPARAASAAMGETLGEFGPLPAVGGAAARGAAKVGKVAGKAVQEKLPDFMDGYMQVIGGRLNLDAWHGSPYKFDAFDASKIGTGEGAQAYGHGVYLADQQGVGASYKLPAGKPPEIRVSGKLLKPDSMEARAFEEFAKFGKDAALRKLDDDIRFNEKYAPDMARLYQSVRKQVEATPDNAVKMNDGHLYRAEIPDEMVARMLDWDAPLSQQSPEVQKAIRAAHDARNKQTGGGFTLDMSQRGSDIVPTIGEGRLRAAGIPGIRYLDGGSRGAGTGTRNYVVFPGEERSVRILERDGKPVKGAKP